MKKVVFKDMVGQDVFVGDILESEWDYRVVVTPDKDGEGYHGKLVCEPSHSCANMPYALNGGLGHRKVGSVVIPQSEDQVRRRRRDELAELALFWQISKGNQEVPE